MPNKKAPKFGQKLKVNASFTFINKSICPKCGEPPRFYFFMKMPTYYKSVQDAINISSLIQKSRKRAVKDYFLVASPSEFTNLVAFKAKNYTKYKTKIHRSKYVEKFNGQLMSDCLTCKCRQTVWSFQQLFQSPESEARHSRICTPIKFKY